MASGLLDDYLRAKIDLPWLNLDFLDSTIISSLNRSHRIARFKSFLL